MKRWNRWQDYAAVLAGLYVALATIWTTQQASPMAMMIGVGVLLILSGVWNLMTPGQPAAEWILLLSGALLFISPWIAGYTAHNGATWTSWIAGGVALIVGILAMQPTTHPGVANHHGGATAH